MKRKVLSTLSLATIILVGCTNNNVKKGSFKNLSYNKPITGNEAQNIKTSAQNNLGKYSKFSITYYTKTSEKNNTSETYRVLSGYNNEDGSVKYTIKTSIKSNANGVKVEYETNFEHILRLLDGGIMADAYTNLDNGETGVNQVYTATQPSVYVLQTYWSIGSFANMLTNYSGNIFKTTNGAQIVQSNINESHTYQSLGSASFEAINILRSQSIINVNTNTDDSYINKATYYYDVRRNYDNSTSDHYKSIQETQRSYLEISFKR